MASAIEAVAFRKGRSPVVLRQAAQNSKKKPDARAERREERSGRVLPRVEQSRDNLGGGHDAPSKLPSCQAGNQAPLTVVAARALRPGRTAS